MSSLLLFILFLLIVVGALPGLPASRKWKFMPTGALGFVVIIMLLLLIIGWL